MADAALVEETEKRLRSHKGVVGFIVINADGIAIRTTMGNEETVHYAALVSRFAAKCRACTRKLAADDELQFIRVRSAKHEIMIAPDFAGGTEYTLIVVQDPRAGG